MHVGCFINAMSAVPIKIAPNSPSETFCSFVEHQLGKFWNGKVLDLLQLQLKFKLRYNRGPAFSTRPEDATDITHETFLPTWIKKCSRTS